MPGDYSRKTFNRKKHYSGVLMQQGRVQLDSDWNEQLDIQLYRTETEAIDVIGASGVPKKNDGFKIGIASGGHDLTISAGRIYVEGLLCELEAPATYTTQPHYPNPDFTTPITSPPSSPPTGVQVALADGTYLVYVDAWGREITALDDKLIREVALEGPDTTTRLQTVFQVKVLPLDPASPPGSITCKTPLDEFDLETALSTGTLNARTQPPQPADSPCLLPPSAGYSRLENQLYRVEVQNGGALNQATFKWSRDNASVETRIEEIDAAVVTVTSLGRDDVLGFAPGQWVEIVDDESSLNATPHPLVQIDSIEPATRKVTLKSSVASLANLSGLKLRRWDQSAGASASGVSANAAPWIDLEGGIQVRFASGQYHAGDYWLIPARTATAEIEWPPYAIPNTSPIPQPPRGVRHHYSRLALIDVVGGVLVFKQDCRKRFPPLTEICAEDVCFDDDHCKLQGADTVQKAIDALCDARDLRFHNKHLHGWGIVCGLQVECGPDPLGQQRRHVTVKKGYALTCEGDDIILKNDDRIDLLNLIAEQMGSPPVDASGDTAVALVLDPTSRGELRYRVEPLPKSKNSFESLFKGTLLFDFFNECIQPLVDFVRDEFTAKPGETKTPVGPTQKRITTFSNLLIQLTNSQNGAFVFLSGEKGQSDPNFEDTILREFYTKLRALLQSHTFCAMFDGARPFPDYPYSGLGITTIFSKGFKTRFRVSPDGAFGYAVGANNKINLFDLNKGEMIDELEFPGGSSAIVTDVAFSRNGNQLYAVATVNDKDSMFVVADISGDGTKHVFRKPTMICDALIVTLGVNTEVSENVFGIGKGKGLYSINPLNVDSKAPPFYAFNATGQLAIGPKDRTAFAAAASQGTNAETYDRVLRLDLSTKDPNPPTFFLNDATIPLHGDDDLALGDDSASTLYVVVDPPSGKSNKHVLIFDTSRPQQRLALVDLQQNTAIRLANNPTTNHMMVSYEDSYRVGLITRNNVLAAEFVPVQVSPLGMAVSTELKRTFVLNVASNTISSIPSERFATGNQIPLKPLVDYRADVLNAFADLFGGLLQYLKDCFCEHLLVDCPQCGEDDKLYLARIGIRNGQVHDICNFSLRKYVHSFPTVEYWLSIVPVIPLLKKAVEQICCSVLPGVFGNFTAPRPEPPANTAGAASNTLQGKRIRQGITFTQQADFRTAFSQVAARAVTGRPVLNDFIKTMVNDVVTPAPATLSHADVSGQPITDVTQKFEAQGVIVDKVERYDPNNAGRNLVEFTAAPIRLDQGSRVKLVTDGDKVLFYTRADAPPPAVDQFRADLDATRKAAEETRASAADTKAGVDLLRPRIDELNLKIDSTRTELNLTQPAIATLRVELDANRRALEESRTATTESKAAVERLTPQVDDLRATVVTNAADLATSKASIDAALKMRDEIEGLKAELQKTRELHQKELVARDKEIEDLKVSTKDLQVTIKRVSDLQTRLNTSTLTPKPKKPVLRKKPPKE